MHHRSQASSALLEAAGGVTGADERNPLLGLTMFRGGSLPSKKGKRPLRNQVVPFYTP